MSCYFDIYYNSNGSRCLSVCAHTFIVSNCSAKWRIPISVFVPSSSPSSLKCATKAATLKNHRIESFGVWGACDNKREEISVREIMESKCVYAPCICRLSNIGLSKQPSNVRSTLWEYVYIMWKLLVGHSIHWWTMLQALFPFYEHAIMRWYYTYPAVCIGTCKQTYRSLSNSTVKIINRTASIKASKKKTRARATN